MKVSPLARAAFESDKYTYTGFDMLDAIDELSWQTVERHNLKSRARKQPACSHIQKIENYDNKKCPIVRFRSSLEGPCVGERFASVSLDLFLFEASFNLSWSNFYRFIDDNGFRNS